MSTDVHEASSAQPPTRVTRSKLRLVVVGATLIVAAAGAIAVFARGGQEQSTTKNITATLRVGGEPNGVAAGPDALWVALNEGAPALDAHLDRINLATGAVAKSIPMRGVLSETRRVGTSVWTERLGDFRDTKPGALLALDWNTGRVQRRIAFDDTPFGYDFGAGSLWVVVGRNPATLVRLDPTTGKQIGKKIVLSTQRVIGLAFGAGAVWAAAAEDGELLRVDPATGRVDRVKVGDFPVGITVANGDVWVANRDGGNVSRVDPEKMEVVDTIDAGTYPTWMAAAGGSVWVANQDDGTVTRIDAATGEVEGPPIRIAPAHPGNASAHIVAPQQDSVWVSSITQKTVTRLDAGQ
jgi:DNA-binding beta-propeller fold protein YncE